MKLSLSWIFDHIDADWHTIAIPDFIAQFTNTIAELEHSMPVSLEVTNYSLAYITQITDNAIQVHSSEWLSEYELPVRPHAVIGQWYLIHKDNSQKARWATLSDFNSSKEGLLPAFFVPDASSTTGWKRALAFKDYVLDIDNKSINNRPDLWSHRGMAREIATMLCLPLKPETAFLADIPVRFFDDMVSPTAQNPIGITLKQNNACSRFSGIYLNTTVQTCDLGMSLRLARVDIKPLNYIVDVTNYVMLDFGQPIHAYDAEKISTHVIVPRFASAGETISLLDGKTITLTNRDYVIGDKNTPLALAGILGGTQTAVSSTTTQLFVEAACFDATMIRQSALHHKLRTEAAVRFEKGLDPEQTTRALQRMVQLLLIHDPTTVAAPYILSLGTPTSKKSLSISHAFIEKLLGTTVDPEKAEQILQQLGFEVTLKNMIYDITIPSFRAVKDVTLKQDIVEEIGRFIGYQSITPVLPTRMTKPTDNSALMRMRQIRNHCAHALHMHEIASYAFFDEQFLSQLSWQPTETIAVANPLSEQWYRLVTSLIPHLIRAVVLNSAQHDTLRFFECARIWRKKESLQETSVISGILFHKHSVDFYQAQQKLQSLFDALSLKHVTWHRIDAPEEAWFMPHQTADIAIGSVVIGRAGKINPLFLHTVVEGDAFIFELDAQFLKTFKPPTAHYKPLSKYPDVVRDISILVPIERTAESLKQVIKAVTPTIATVDLIDFFHNPAWKDKKALTFRYILRDPTKTFTKQEADEIGVRIVQALETYGAQVR